MKKKELMITKLKSQLDHYNKLVKEESDLRAKLECQPQVQGNDDSFGEVFDLKKSQVEDFGLLDD